MDFIKVEIKEEDKVKEELLLRRTKRVELKKLIDLQKIIIEDFIYFNGNVGSFIAEDKCWNNLLKISKYIPVDGLKEGFPIEKIENDFSLISRLFFSDNWEELDFNSLDIKPEPSLICKLNKLDYDSALGKSIMSVQNKKKLEMQELTEKYQTPTLTN